MCRITITNKVISDIKADIIELEKERDSIECVDEKTMDKYYQKQKAIWYAEKL